MKTCTIALTRRELLTLSIVAHDGLTGDVHAIVTCGIPAKDKTRLLCNLANEWHETMNQLDWVGVEDGQRAYRQISDQKLAALIIALRDFTPETVSQGARANFEETRPVLMEVLTKALVAPALPSDATQPLARA